MVCRYYCADSRRKICHVRDFKGECFDNDRSLEARLGLLDTTISTLTTSTSGTSRFTSSISSWEHLPGLISLKLLRGVQPLLMTSGPVRPCTSFTNHIPESYPTGRSRVWRYGKMIERATCPSSADGICGVPMNACRIISSETLRRTRLSIQGNHAEIKVSHWAQSLPA